VPQAVPVLEIGVVLLAAALAGALSRRLGLPAVLGYLLVGLLVGPFTPGYVADRRQIQVLADMGVVLLLFEVGIELDLRALRREPRGILLAVPLQIAIGTLVGALAFMQLGTGVLGAVTIGLAVALSSSVVVVNITRSRRRTTDPVTDRALVVWAILQDAVTLVAATILAVLLAQSGDAPALALGKVIAFVGFAAVAQLVVMPWLLAQVRDQPDISSSSPSRSHSRTPASARSPSASRSRSRRSSPVSCSRCGRKRTKRAVRSCRSETSSR